MLWASVGNTLTPSCPWGRDQHCPSRCPSLLPPADSHAMEEDKPIHMDYIKHGTEQPCVSSVGLSPAPKHCLAPPDMMQGARLGQPCAGGGTHAPTHPCSLAAFMERCTFPWSAAVPCSTQPHHIWHEGRGPCRQHCSRRLSLKAVSLKVSAAPAHAA